MEEWRTVFLYYRLRVPGCPLVVVVSQGSVLVLFVLSFQYHFYLLIQFLYQPTSVNESGWLTIQKYTIKTFLNNRNLIKNIQNKYG